jgi:RHS repeat-associated protein
VLETHENREQLFSLAAVVAGLETRAGAEARGGKKPHQGVSGVFSAPHRGHELCNSTIALGLQTLTVENRIGSRCTGKERDSETGLDDFGARYFASNMGRFMTPDWAEGPSPVPYASIGFPQSLNLYAYAENNPVTLADASGHCSDASDPGASQNTCPNYDPNAAPGSSGEGSDHRTDQGYYLQYSHSGSQATGEAEYEQDQVAQLEAAGLSPSQIVMPSGNYASGVSAAGADVTPSKLDIDYSQTVKGKYSSTFYYRLENAEGQMLVGRYQLKEHNVKDFDYGAQLTLKTSNDQFLPQVKPGIFGDDVGLEHKPNFSYMEYGTTQTFSVSSWGSTFPLTSVFHQDTLVMNGNVSSFVWDVGMVVNVHAR